MRILATLALLIATAPLPGSAAQIGDPHADVTVTAPAFQRDKGPVVAVDSGHFNFHTIDGRFGPFGRLLSNDGFTVKAHEGTFTAASLGETSILVIANALGPANTENWSRPIHSAFTKDEIAVVKRFVEAGGSLLLIADHMPFGGAAIEMGTAFGFTFIDGFAFYVPEPAAPDFFSVADSTLAKDIVTIGKSVNDPIDRLATFTGSAFRAPSGARPLLRLSSDYVVMIPATAWQFLPDTPRLSGDGLLQGAVMPYGRGRIAVFAEAAMFTAQIEDTNPGARIGFTAPGAEQNKQFVLNVAHWLAGLLGP